MKLIIQNNKYLILIIGGLLLLTVFILVSLSSTSNMSLGPSPEPTVFDTETPNRPREGGTYQTITDEGKKQIDNDALIGQLVKKMPYESASFSLDYSFRDNSFLLQYRRSDRVQSLSDLKRYLNENGIESQDLLYNLVVKEI